MTKSLPQSDATATDEQLCSQASAGDRRSEEVLIMRYNQLVRSISRPFFLLGSDQEDLIQEGMFGLLRAIHKFDPERGVSFKTFAGQCIRNCVLNAVRDASAVRHQPLNSALSLDQESQDQVTYFGDPEYRIMDSDAFDERLLHYKSLLSPFENQVLDLYLKGYTRQEMAQRLESSVKSVDNALQRLRSKLRAQSS